MGQVKLNLGRNYKQVWEVIKFENFNLVWVWELYFSWVTATLESLNIFYKAFSLQHTCCIMHVCMIPWIFQCFFFYQYLFQGLLMKKMNDSQVMRLINTSSPWRLLHGKIKWIKSQNSLIYPLVSNNHYASYLLINIYDNC